MLQVLSICLSPMTDGGWTNTEITTTAIINNQCRFFCMELPSLGVLKQCFALNIPYRWPKHDAIHSSSLPYYHHTNQS